jgi:uncharacterized protein YjiS (DUF1127 family)
LLSDVRCCAQQGKSRPAQLQHQSARQTLARKQETIRKNMTTKDITLRSRAACRARRSTGFHSWIFGAVRAHFNRQFDQRLLNSFNDRMLKDIGLHRSEITSALIHCDRRHHR